MRRSALALALASSLLFSCGHRRAHDVRVAPPGAEPPEAGSHDGRVCPARLDAPRLLPGTAPADRSSTNFATRLARTVDVDAELLPPERIDAANRAILASDDADDLRLPPDASLEASVRSRLAELSRAVTEGALVAEAHADAATRVALANPLVVDSVPRDFVANEGFQLRCGPFDSALVSRGGDARFDRNLCSRVRPRELFEIVGRAGDFALVRTRTAIGFAFRPEGHARAVDRDEARLAFVADGRAPDEAPRKLTRRAFLEEAFRYLDSPYGWGGANGGRDCSAFVMDVLGAFGLSLPRHSRDQAEAGTFSIELAPSVGEDERRSILDAANARGIVLIYFPGHIAIYLGRGESGEPMALHSFAEYLEPCAGGGETLRIVPGVTVSTLELGRGTSRRAFLERITRVVAIGGAPGPALEGIAELGRTAPLGSEELTCARGLDRALFESPRRPYASAPMSLSYVSAVDPGPTRTTIVRSDGTRFELPVTRYPGPPYGYVARWQAPEAGEYVAYVGDGARVLACARVHVDARKTPASRGIGAVVRPWDRDTEAFYSLFVQALFDHSDDVRTWPSLTPLLRDPEHNLLYDHFGESEDESLRLEPDCADLPYVLRAYFAWKKGLAFGFRACGGGTRSPPRCGALETMSGAASGEDVARDFGAFARERLQAAVRSSGARTAPGDSATDLYPVALDRASIRPGTVYADPYGHVMLVVGYRRATFDTRGTLVAADAQPDGTIGRPIFWRGTFLFTPRTDVAGAGFKAWRPIVSEHGAIRSATNDELARSDEFVRISHEAYEGSADDFYERMEALADPVPRTPEQRLFALVDAFEETVRRRVVSVDNAERWAAEHPGAVVAMPEGASIFLTAGAWEDFSTPSRDLRLLIGLDAVLGFPERVRRVPERFGVDVSEAPRVADELRAALARNLRERSITYRASDGSERTLALDDVRERAKAFELAYNPNDCVEVRWGAPEGSEERRTCRRRAPEAQRAKMESYRVWFAERRRPG